MVKAIARAFRWREMLENGEYATIAEIAAAEKINEIYVGRVLRLTLLAPDIVEAILSGRQAVEITLAVLVRPFSVLWETQRSAFSASPRVTAPRISPSTSSRGCPCRRLPPVSRGNAPVQRRLHQSSRRSRN